MNQKMTLSILAASISLMSFTSNAGALKPDCNAKKAGKNVTMKATIGVGGRCSPADAAKDSAKGVAVIEENKKNKGKNENREKNQKNSLKKESEKEKGLLKKAIN